MSNDRFKNGGASSIGDLARQGGDVNANLHNLMDYGAGFWSDMARNEYLRGMSSSPSNAPESGNFVLSPSGSRLKSPLGSGVRYA